MGCACEKTARVSRLVRGRLGRHQHPTRLVTWWRPDDSLFGGRGAVGPGRSIDGAAPIS